MTKFRIRVKRSSTRWQRFWEGIKPDGTTVLAGIKVVLAVGALKIFVVVSPQETPASMAVVEAHYTGPGQPADVVLPALSVVLHLNGDTAIVVRSVPQSGEVILERGELQAQVEHNDLRQFRVTIGRLVVQDLGTEFNILALGDTTHFAITQGEAQLFERREDGELVDPEMALSGTSRAREPLVVRAGDVVDIAHGADGAVWVTRKVRDPLEANTKAEWRHGVVSFDAIPLGEAVKMVNMYHDGKLVVDDPELARLKLGGSFDPANLDDFLKGMRALEGIDSWPPKNPDGVYPEMIHLRRSFEGARPGKR